MGEALRPAIVGGLAGIVMVMTTGYLVTGYAFHRFQKLTPATWRRESWRQHMLAIVWAAASGAALGTLEGFLPAARSGTSAMGVAVLVWAAAAAPIIATIATYVNLHVAVAAGLLLEWLALLLGVALACHWWAA